MTADYALCMSTLAENVSAVLDRARRDGTARQNDIAAAIGVNQSTLSRWGSGSKPEPEALIALARYLGVSVEMLVEVPFTEWDRADRSNFAHARKMRGLTPATMATQVQALIRRERGSAKVSADAIRDYEAGLGDVAPPWLEYAQMALQEGSPPAEQDTAPRGELVYVRQADIRFAMGDGAELDPHADTELVPFNLEFLTTITRSPLERLFLATGIGNSMEPTIEKHDVILIDTADVDFSSGDVIWALRYAGQGYVKRLRRVVREGREKIAILSDNAMVPEELADPVDVSIVGKVIWIGRKMI